MTRQMNTLYLDCETASQANLKKVGAFHYAEDPSTRVLCVAWALNDEPTQVWPALRDNPPPMLLQLIRSCDLFVAHNTVFELCILSRTLPRQFPLVPSWMPRKRTIRDSMLKAAYWGLPLSLGEVMPAIHAPMPFWKNVHGHRLMLKMCKPRGVDPFGNPTWWWHDPTVGLTLMHDLMSYCKQDVEAERWLWKTLPAVPAAEVALWHLDLEIQARGVALDATYIDRLRHVALRTSLELDKAMAGITSGAVRTCHKVTALLAWLHSKGFMLPDLTAETVREWLANVSAPGAVTTMAYRALSLRQDAARSSVAKLAKMRGVMCQDGRARGMLQFYGAGRTGRYAGRLIQWQNLPRGSKFITKMQEWMATAGDADETRKRIELFSPLAPLETVAALLRGCLIAAPGKTLVVSDLGQIEARVLAWVAGQLDVLAVFEKGDDLYVFMASRIGSTSRQLGKVVVLACGYGMGKVRFRETATTYGLALSEGEAEDAVTTWRQANDKTVSFWYECDTAFRGAILVQGGEPPVATEVGPQGIIISPARVGSMAAVTIKLPSGRRLCYLEPELRPDPHRADRTRISYMGLDQKPGQWGRIDTWGGKIVENIVQAIARDVLMEGIKGAEARNVPVLTSIHDEVIGEADMADGPAKLRTLNEAMTAGAPWTKGLPLAAEGWHGPRYRKN